MPRDHVIRLRGPWEYRAWASPSAVAGRITLPADWGSTLGPDFRGRVAYRRRFGCPTGLEPGDRVDLVIDRVDALGSVRLNDEPLGDIPVGGQAWRCDVTRRLGRRNELTVEVELPRVRDGEPPPARPGREGLPGGLVGEVRLEIFRVAGDAR